MLDLKIFADADADVCLARRSETQLVRLMAIDANAKARASHPRCQRAGSRYRRVRSKILLIITVVIITKLRCIKQWMKWVKPNFERYVEPQRKVADIIIPCGAENKVAINMVVQHIQRTLKEKSQRHQDELRRLGEHTEDEALSSNVLVLPTTPQIKGVNTILQDPMTDEVDFIFVFDRLSSLLVERALENQQFTSSVVTTPQGSQYNGLGHSGEVSAVVILRGGSCLETGLKRVIPEAKTGRMLVQSNYRTGEPELHYLKLAADIAAHESVLLLDPQMNSGGAALMAVRVLLDHGVQEDKVVFVTLFAGRMGLNRLMKVYPNVRVVVGEVVEDSQDRWVERRYFGC